MVDFCTGVSRPYSYCSGGLSCILTIHQLHRYFSRETVFFEAPTQLEGSVMPEHACNNSSRDQKGLEDPSVEITARRIKGLFRLLQQDFSPPAELLNSQEARERAQTY